MDFWGSGTRFFFGGSPAGYLAQRVHVYVVVSPEFWARRAQMTGVDQEEWVEMELGRRTRQPHAQSATRPTEVDALALWIAQYGHEITVWNPFVPTGRDGKR